MDTVILLIIGLFAFVVLIMGLMGLSVTNNALPNFEFTPPCPEPLKKEHLPENDLTDQILNEYWKQTQM